MEAKEKFCEYILNLLGAKLILRPFAPQGLPFYLTELYDLRTSNFENHPILFCFSSGAEHSTPAQIEQHDSLLKKTCNLDTVFVFPELSSWNRQRLIDRKISFVVPGKQLYLPALLIDLREHFSYVRKNGEWLSFPAQYILLEHLVHASIEGRAVRELARTFQYSPITMSRAVDDLIQHGLAETKAGKTKPLHFSLPKDKLWRAAQPFLRSPVKSKQYWLAGEILPPWPKAGIAGLAALSDLNEDLRDCRAVTQGELKPYIGGGRVLSEPRCDEDTLLEIWAYKPLVLGGEKTVDPYSLYLSMGTEKDERVRKALDKLIRGSL